MPRPADGDARRYIPTPTIHVILSPAKDLAIEYGITKRLFEVPNVARAVLRECSAIGEALRGDVLLG